MLTMINKKMNENKEEIRKLKITEKITTAETTNIDQTKINNPLQHNFKKWKCGLCNEQRPARKHQLTQSNKLCGRNYENFIQLQSKIQDTNGLQFDPAGNVINLISKTFNRDVFKLSNKNLNFVLMQKYFKKKKLYNEINGFY